MLIKQLLFFTSLTVSCITFSMDIVPLKNCFDDIPADILPAILVRKNHQYPWQDFIHVWKLGGVCTTWRDTIGNTDQLATSLNIPAMHYAAMMNDANKIIALKLAGHSPLAPDSEELIPADYALACRQRDALTMLHLGSATLRYPTCARQGYEKMVETLQSFPTDQYTEEDVIEAVVQNDYNHIITILSDDLSLLAPEVLEEAESLGFNIIANLLRYIIQCTLEDLLHLHIRTDRNISENIYQKFVKYNANPNAYNELGSTPLHWLVWHKDLLPTLQKLLQLENIDINLPHLLKGYNAIESCASAGNIKYLRELLEAKKIKNETFSNTDDALNCAVCSNHVDCLELLLQYGANINTLDEKFGLSPLHHAAINGRRDCLITLLNSPQCPIDIIDIMSTGGFTPLMETVKHGQTECMNLLLARGADGSAVTKGKSTLMHLAALNGSKKCLKRLLSIPQFKHQINKQDTCGYSPLINTARYNHALCMLLLINAKANIDACDENQQTALHFAAAKGHGEALTLLIQNGASIDCVSGPNYIQVTNDGHYTPLHFAAQEGQNVTAAILIGGGADVHLKTQLGKTALDLARENNHPEVVAALLYKLKFNLNGLKPYQ